MNLRVAIENWVARTPMSGTGWMRDDGASWFSSTRSSLPVARDSTIPPGRARACVRREPETNLQSGGGRMRCHITRPHFGHARCDLCRGPCPGRAVGMPKCQCIVDEIVPSRGFAWHQDGTSARGCGRWCCQTHRSIAILGTDDLMAWERASNWVLACVSVLNWQRRSAAVRVSVSNTELNLPLAQAGGLFLSHVAGGAWWLQTGPSDIS